MSKKLFEDYVKAVYEICLGSETAKANTGSLARMVGVCDGTASTTIRNVADAGLVVLTPYEGAQLTEAGRSLAIRVVRRHHLIVLLLSKLFDMELSEVESEAELLEHAVSDKLADRIDSFLGHPTFNIHGDPMPRHD